MPQACYWGGCEACNCTAPGRQLCALSGATKLEELSSVGAALPGAWDLAAESVRSEGAGLKEIAAQFCAWLIAIIGMHSPSWQLALMRPDHV